MFRAELLKAQNQMSGWCNIFFCAQDIEISDKLIEKLNAYDYKNHLAHIYIYAYDNKPEIVAKAYRSEAFLIYFSKGVALAKRLAMSSLSALHTGKYHDSIHKWRVRSFPVIFDPYL